MLGPMLQILPSILPIINSGIEIFGPTLVDGFKSGFGSKSFQSSAMSGVGKAFTSIVGGLSKRNERTSMDRNLELPATILPTPEALSREGGMRYFPKFDDEYSSMDRMNGREQYMRPLSREQFGNRNNGFSSEGDQSYGAYEGGRQTGFKRPYNVYSDNSLGSGYGSTSMVTRRNDYTIGGNNGSMMTRNENRGRTQMPSSFGDEDYEPTRKFIRRVPSQSQLRNRFQTDRVSNLNLSERDYSMDI